MTTTSEDMDRSTQLGLGTKEHFWEASRLLVDPDSLEPLLALGRTLFEIHRYREAADIFRFLILRRHSGPEAWYWLGRAHEELGESSRAESVYRIAAQTGLSPHFATLARRVACPTGAPSGSARCRASSSPCRERVR